ncbi:MAG: hypothetical protein M3347_10545 [Armatimonadota bacterium]|nr:hypothetical protein [Armatimonadota bacterium]
MGNNQLPDPNQPWPSGLSQDEQDVEFIKMALQSIAAWGNDGGVIDQEVQKNGAKEAAKRLREVAKSLNPKHGP